jgi:translation initiation factor IF-2
MAQTGNGARVPDPPRPNGSQKPLPGLPAPQAKPASESEADKRKREIRERIEKQKKEREEREAKEKAAAKPEPAKTEAKSDAKAEPAPAATAPVDATMRRFEELLRNGGFTRRLTWRQRRALRKIERRCDRVRTALHDAFAGEPPEGVLVSMDSLAALEAVARLEMLCAKAD